MATSTQRSSEGNLSSTIYDEDYPPFNPETPMQHRSNSGGVGGGSTRYRPQEYFQRAAQMQMKTDQLQVPAMGVQNSSLWRQAADVQPQEPSALHPSERMLQLVMQQMAAMSEQLVAQNVILQGRSSKQPKEPGGGVTGATRQNQSVTTMGARI